MLHSWSLENLSLQGVWLAIGSFDGVHLGHQAVLKEVIHGSHLEGAPAVVLTFYPHPAAVLGKRDGAFYLNTPEEKAEIMAGLGLDALVTHPFNLQVSRLSAREFVLRLKRHLGFRRLFVGRDFALGKDREGDLKLLKALGRELDFQVETIEPIRLQQRVISSSWVRRALAEGDLASVHALLGRDYRVGGEVVHGDSRGKTLGFPTANLEIWEKRLLPKLGVYVGWAHISGKDFAAVSNVGYRPTFENQPERPRLEVYVLDFDQDLYGQQVSFTFTDRLRDEVRFNSIQELVDQIDEDIQQARQRLEVNSDAAVPRFTSANS